MKLQWWEGNPNSIVLLEPSFMKALDGSKEIAAAIGVSARTLQRWKTGSRHPTLKNLLKLANVLKIRKPSLNGKILGFCSSKGERVWRVKYPIMEHPYHAGIIAHGFFDGNECCGVLVYGTLTKEENDDFARLAEKSNLGAYLLDYSRDRKGLPASITQLLKNHYQVETFLSDRCIFSERLMSLALKSSAYRKEILRAAFLDEGHVTLKNGICAFGIKNERLTYQLYRLLDAGGYRHWSAQTPSETQVYLRFGSCRKFYTDLLLDMPATYRKNRVINRFLANSEAFHARMKLRSETRDRIMSMVKKSGKMALDDIYDAFGVKHSNKKAFYDSYMRKLKNLHLIETIKQGDTAWVLVPESGKSKA